MIYDKQFDLKYERKAIAWHALQTRAIRAVPLAYQPKWFGVGGTACNLYRPTTMMSRQSAYRACHSARKQGMLTRVNTVMGCNLRKYNGLEKHCYFKKLYYLAAKLDAMNRFARIWLVLGVATISNVAQAQHDHSLTSNYSFEELKPQNNGETLCPASTGQIYLAKSWESAYGSTDYYSACSNGSYPDFGVPQNRVGYQEAVFGEAYAMIGCYSSNYVDAREYIWQELDSTLSANAWYRLRFKVSLADSLNFAVKGIGGLLSVDNTRNWDRYDFFNIPLMIPELEGPQVEFADSVISDKEGWTEVSGVFQANGGEKYLTIGSFNTDADEEIERVSNNPQGTYSWDVSGYYIDNVILEEVTDPSGIEEPEVTDFSIFPNPVAPNDWFTVRYMHVNRTGKEETVLVFHDMRGRQVKKMTVPYLSDGIPVSTDGLTTGTYAYWLLIDGSPVKNGKLVVR